MISVIVYWLCSRVLVRDPYILAEEVRFRLMKFDYMIVWLLLDVLWIEFELD